MRYRTVLRRVHKSTELPPTGLRRVSSTVRVALVGCCKRGSIRHVAAHALISSFDTSERIPELCTGVATALAAEMLADASFQAHLMRQQPLLGVKLGAGRFFQQKIQLKDLILGEMWGKQHDVQRERRSGDG